MNMSKVDELLETCAADDVLATADLYQHMDACLEGQDFDEVDRFVGELVAKGKSFLLLTAALVSLGGVPDQQKNKDILAAKAREVGKKEGPCDEAIEEALKNIT
jgi:hypothetical protein